MFASCLVFRTLIWKNNLEKIVWIWTPSYITKFCWEIVNNTVKLKLQNFIRCFPKPKDTSAIAWLKLFFPAPVATKMIKECSIVSPWRPPQALRIYTRHAPATRSLLIDEFVAEWEILDSTHSTVFRTEKWTEETPAWWLCFCLHTIKGSTVIYYRTLNFWRVNES